MTRAEPFVFLDDDPTGAQAVADVPVVLRWEERPLQRALSSGARSVHVLTNSRALTAQRAETVVHDAARAVAAAAPDAPILLRGDSTLRGHLLEEYRAVWRARAQHGAPVLLLVPALPAAGRITRGGVHYLVRDGVPVALNETEYARDGGFTYRSARLLEWADERSAGVLAAARGVEVPLRVLRERGAESIVQAIDETARRGAPSVCAPDAETIADLELIATGLRQALDSGTTVTVRCAPAFAGVLAGTLAKADVAPPPVRDGALIVCGSYVENTTQQLDYLRRRRGLEPIELDPRVLAGSADAADDAARRAAEQARQALGRDRLALVATKRTRPPETRSLDAGLRIARHLAHVAAYVGEAADVVIAKGGITSAVTLEEGLGAAEARVVGPVMPGVALWRPQVERNMSYFVVPGNVGPPSLLADLLERIGI